MKTYQAMLTAMVVVMTPMMGPARAQPAPALLYTQALSGAATAMVQDRLLQAGVYAGRPDGIWGPESQSALERFQQTRNLQVTGQMNQATAATLGVPPAELLAARTAPAPAAPPVEANDPLSRDAVRKVQQRLRALGFYRGGSDGIWGAGTQVAIERFQQGRGLQPTGQVNPATMQALGLDPNNPGARLR